jgi:ABC-2 type transport system permease protein
MGLNAFLAMVRKDLLLFLSDRRAVIFAFAVPIVIGSFIGSMTNNMGRNSNEPLRIKIALADLDGSDVSKAIVSAAQSDPNLNVTVTTAENARDLVRKGTVGVAVVVPMAFGERAGRAFFRGAAAEKPELGVLSDPSRAVEVGMVRGILMQHVMQAVSTSVFSGQSGSRFADEALANLDSSSMPPDRKRLLKEMLTGVQRYYRNSSSSSTTGGTGGVFSMPYTVHEQEVTAGNQVPYNGYAHSFAGMGIQFLLFAALNLGIEMLVERQRGLWRRFRSAPVSRYTLLGARAVSASLISMATLLVSFGFAMIVFKVRIEGSLTGFLMVAAACSMMAATFGLLVAALGRTPGAARGISTLAVLVMVMLGGAWIPSFLFPKWLQAITFAVPARWAVDGLDAMTWRGLGLSNAVAPTLALLGFAAVFGFVSVTRFRWDEP